MPDTHRLLVGLMEKTIATAGEGGRIVRAFPAGNTADGVVAAVHTTDDLTFLSFALPRPSLSAADLTPSVVADVRAFFAAHRRVLRFEFFQPLHPWLADRLAACGLRSEGDMPLMACGRGDLAPPPPPPADVTLHDLSPAADDDLLRRFFATAKTVFGQPPTVPDAELVDHRRNLIAGDYRSAYAATADGRVVGVGTMSAGNDELVGIGTLEPFRRRGIAAAISARLVGDHFARGADLAWLSAAGAVPEGVYRKVGFRPVGVQQNYVEASWDGRTRPGAPEERAAHEGH